MRRVERSQADRRLQPLAHGIEHPRPALARQHRMVERDREDLVRAAGGIVPDLAVDDIVQIAAAVVPEAAVERLGGAPRRLPFVAQPRGGNGKPR